MERLLLGEPTEIIGVKGVGDFTEDEAIRELELGAQTAHRMRERKARREGRLKLLQGGKYRPPGTRGRSKSDGHNGCPGPTNGVLNRPGR